MAGVLGSEGGRGDGVARLGLPASASVRSVRGTWCRGWGGRWGFSPPPPLPVPSLGAAPPDPPSAWTASSSNAGRARDSQYSGRQATTKRAFASWSQFSVPSSSPGRGGPGAGAFPRGRRGGAAGGGRSGGRGRARRLRGDVAQAGAVRRPTRPRSGPPGPARGCAASATEVSSSRRSAPRSHRVGAGSVSRWRRAARAASSVVRPLPGCPDEAEDDGRVSRASVNALNSLASSARSTAGGRPRRRVPPRPSARPAVRPSPPRSP